MSKHHVHFHYTGVTAYMYNIDLYMYCLVYHPQIVQIKRDTGRFNLWDVTVVLEQ